MTKKIKTLKMDIIVKKPTPVALNEDHQDGALSDVYFQSFMLI